MESIKNEVKKILRKVVDECKGIRAETDQARRKIDSGDFSSEFIERELMPIINANRTKTRDALTKGFNAVSQALKQYEADAWAENRLRGDELTDDARLFNLGIRLPIEELEGVYDRSAGNKTMQRLTWMYAQQHKIQLNRPVVANLADAKNLSRDLLIASDTFLSHWCDHDKAAEMLDKFFPEDDGASGAKG